MIYIIHQNLNVGGEENSHKLFSDCYVGEIESLERHKGEEVI